MAIVKSSVGVSDSRSDRGLSSSSGDGSSIARTDSDSEGSVGPGCSSEVDSGMESDDFDYSGLGESGAEFCQVGSQSCLVPYEIYDLPDLSEVLSLDVWNDCLTEEERFALSEYLPDMDQEMFMQTLRELFGRSDFYFGSPLTRLFEQLKGGLCEPRVVLYRKSVNYLQRREHYYRVMEYHNSMVGSLVQMRDVWEDCEGYGIEERLRVLKFERSRKSLGYGVQGRGNMKVELEANEPFGKRWNKKLDSVARIRYSPDPSLPAISYRSRLDDEHSEYRKERLNGTSKVGGSKSEKGITGPVMGDNRGMAAILGSSEMDLPRAFGSGGRLKSTDRGHHGYGFEADDEEYEMGDFEIKAKHKKKQPNLKRRHGLLLPVDYSDEGTQDCSGLNLHGRKKDANQTTAADSNDRRVSKKSRHIGIDRSDDMEVYMQKPGPHLYSDYITQSPVADTRRKSSQMVGRDADYSNDRSPYLDHEGNNSDLPEQVEEDGDVHSHLKKSRQSKAVMERYQNTMYGLSHDPNGAKINAKRSKKRGDALSQIYDVKLNKYDGQKPQRQVNSYTHGYATETPPVKFSDAQKYMYEDIGEDSYGGRIKRHSTDRMRKGPDFELPQQGMLDYMSGTLMGNEDGVTDANVSQTVMQTDFDSNGKLYAPLSGCKSLATKRKLDKPRHRHGTDRPADSVASKKSGKKKTDEIVTVMAPDQVCPEKEGEVQVEVKPTRKPYTPITPTVHTGFSFSIVHLLSAVRKAMIGDGAEDTAEIGSVGSRKDNGEANPFEGQKSVPSLTVQEIVSRVRSNPGDPSILETQEPLQDLVRGVLRIFSSKTAPLAAKAWKPLVSYEKSNKSWTWIGPLLPSTSDPVEEDTSPEAWDIPHKMLVKLVDAFANWLKSGQETLRKIGSLPPPPVVLSLNLDEKERFKELRAQKSLNTIGASSDAMRDYFRQEEFLRYQIPERAFSYTAADGKKSIVAPLRRGGGKPTSKARDHFMLKPDRPPHVTILCLVRDAAARLPGSIGTRSDVCALIRDSQYIVEDVSDSQVNQVVSGALDRLHYERDPCVQYDSERKLWVYLHRDREEEDFEDDGTSSTKKWKRPRKEAAENADAGIVTIGSHDISGEQDAAGTSAPEFISDPNACLSPTEEKVELVYSDLRPTNENVEPLTSSINGSSHQRHLMPWNIVGMNSVQPGNQMLCQQNCTNEDFDEETFGRGRPVTLVNASLL